MKLIHFKIQQAYSCQISPTKLTFTIVGIMLAMKPSKTGPCKFQHHIGTLESL